MAKCALADCGFEAGSICNRPGCPAEADAGPVTSYAISLQRERDKAESELSLSLAREQQLSAALKQIVDGALPIESMTITGQHRELTGESVVRDDWLDAAREALGSSPVEEREC